VADKMDADRLARVREDGQLAKISSAIYEQCYTPNCIEAEPSLRSDVVYDGDTCVVVFRGTLDINNWITDLEFLQTENDLVPNGGMVHYGFLNAFKLIYAEQKFWSTIAECVSKKVPAMKFTGHSLGAAIATLAVMWFKSTYPAYTGRIHYATFGSPRVGDGAFQSKFLQMLPRMGNRYESVRPPSQMDDWYTLGLTSSTISAPGDHALPGDIIPRVPPMTNVEIEIGDLTAPGFWLGSKAYQFLGGNTDAHGYRHVGVRYQVPCSDNNLLNCHSIANTYVFAFTCDDDSVETAGGNAV